jgi:hypothetical protein
MLISFFDHSGEAAGYVVQQRTSLDGAAMQHMDAGHGKFDLQA